MRKLRRWDQAFVVSKQLHTKFALMFRAGLSFLGFRPQTRVSLLSDYATWPLTEIEGWGLSPRGAGYLFGADVVAQV